MVNVKTKIPEGRPAPNALAERLARLEEAVEHAAEVLPAQPPIRMFVHHNTLHAYEHMHFDEAVRMAARRLGAEPYETEEAFAGHLRRGRILPEDIDAALADDGVPRESILDGGPTLRAFKSIRMQNLFEIPKGAALRWTLEEADGSSTFHPMVSHDARVRLREQGRSIRTGASVADRDAERAAIEALWLVLSSRRSMGPTTKGVVRPRDAILAERGIDTDEWVNPFLIRLCSAFVDQGISYWRMPDRQNGLYLAFRGLYERPWGPPDPWLADLDQELAHQRQNGWSAAQVVLSLLGRLGCSEDEWTEFLEATLLALPGWPGMIRQLESRPDRAPVESLPARLVDFLAVRLTLDVLAARQARATASDMLPDRRGEFDTVTPAVELAYEAFVCAQLMGLGPADFSSPVVADQWLDAVATFDSFERRRLLHKAYERRHRIGVLDALLNHARLGLAPRIRPRAQIVFCIDEREESVRRHLEELRPDVETLGFAGFYGIAMAYRGLHDIKPMPLCPVNILPRHVVIEEAVDPTQAEANRARRRLWGHARTWAFVGSKTAFRGSLVASMVGLASTVALIGRCLMPRMSEQISHRTHRTLIGHPHTRLRLQRRPDADVEFDGLQVGFTTSEMADIVAGALRTMGTGDALAPLFLVVGHGSSSLNNPHEAAHDCGACGGGRGGPNARAFAMMANDPAVRTEMRIRHQLVIPESTWFVGAYHNTCDDAIVYYDADLVPKALEGALADIQQTLERVRRLDAHERCRRFEDAPTDMSLEAALAHAEAHAVDLGQPRPEYGHATNAVCIVGRRHRTRGLFLDRRAFLVSYDPKRDPEGELLGALLQSVGPVGAGINLEYYFSFVDNTRYGCGTKLPHNVTGLLGVMDGHASDLRTGLPWQMVEIHEPVRLLVVVEAELQILERTLQRYPAVANLVRNGWIQLAAWVPSSGEMWVFQGDGLVRYQQESRDLSIVHRSVDHYGGHRGHLPCARIEAALVGEGTR